MPAIAINSPANQLFNNITAILAFLFDAEEGQLRKRDEMLLSKHRQLGGSTDGFRHMGLIHTALVGAARKRGVYDRIHPEVLPDLAALDKERAQLDADKEQIRQALFLVLKDASSFQDIRDAIPECLRHLIPQCKGLERSREEAYTLSDNPRALSQYSRVKDRIDFYVASRLLV